MSQCPCGLPEIYENCCAPYHAGQKYPDTAEQLMRSRYSAFVKAEIPYITSTHHPKTRGEYNEEETRKWAENSEWMGITIKSVEGGGPKDQTGQVEFLAKYKFADKEYTHHELSLFEKDEGKWFFVDGKLVRDPVKREGPKVGRNDPCPCGSGKKFKKCCALATA